MGAYCCDLYVTTLEGMSLKGMVSTGFSGPHELVAGGFKQARARECRGWMLGARPWELVGGGSQVGEGVGVVGDECWVLGRACLRRLPLGEGLGL